MHAKSSETLPPRASLWYLPRRSGSVNIHRYSPPLWRIIVKYSKNKVQNCRTQGAGFCRLRSNVFVLMVSKGSDSVISDISESFPVSWVSTVDRMHGQWRGPEAYKGTGRQAQKFAFESPQKNVSSKTEILVSKSEKKLFVSTSALGPPQEQKKRHAVQPRLFMWQQIAVHDVHTGRTGLEMFSE